MNYDVIVVGGGPAGSTTGKVLSENGIKVAIIEKDKLPRYKPCGGGLPRRVLERFSYINNDRFIESYSYSGIAFSPSLKYKIEVKKEKPLIATALREKFDFELVKLAEEKGADVKEGNKVVDLKISDDKVKVILKDGEIIEGKVIVGADGVWSTVAKKAGLRKQGKVQLGTCALKEFEVDSETLDEFFGKDRMCYVHSRFKGLIGYGWVFPKKEHLNIGIGEIWRRHLDKINLSSYLKDYIDFLIKNKLIPKNMKDVPTKGGVLPTKIDKTYSDRVILVGDAAGFINPASGEGIYYAMSSGEIAAKVIVEAIEKEDFSSKFLSKYQKLWMKDFGGDLKLIDKISGERESQDLDEIFRIVSSDKILSEMIYGVLVGELSVKEYKGKIVKRYMYCLVKDKIKR